MGRSGGRARVKEASGLCWGRRGRWGQIIWGFWTVVEGLGFIWMATGALRVSCLGRCRDLMDFVQKDVGQCCQGEGTLWK